VICAHPQIRSMKEIKERVVIMDEFFGENVLLSSLLKEMYKLLQEYSIEWQRIRPQH